MGDKKSQDFFVVNFLDIFLLDGLSNFFNSGEGKLPEVFQAVHVNSAIWLASQHSPWRCLDQYTEVIRSTLS